MIKTSLLTTLVAGVWLAAATFAPAQEATVATMLQIKPKFDDVAVSTPTADEIKDCKVEDVIEGGKKIGYVLLDGRKQVLRRFVMTGGATRLNVYSFYKDGVEVFRMSATKDKVDQYRWLGTAGMKWGHSSAADGRIDTWLAISAEEVAHEAFLALASNDFARLKALYITPAEVQSLGLPAPAAAKVLQAQQAAQAKFQQARQKHPGLDKATYLRVESAAPGCWTADSQGTPRDVIKFASRQILFEPADKKHDWFQTGEIVQVGATWRLIEIMSESNDVADQKVDNPQLNRHLADLSDTDKKIGETPNPNPTQKHPVLAGLYEQRAKLCEEILKLVDAKERESWYKQLLDSYSSAAIAGSDSAMNRLSKYREQIVGAMKGSNLAGYATYRELWALFGPKLADQTAGQKAQEAYNEHLVKFVRDYPTADDTPDALHQLGMNSEFDGRKEKEEEAAKYYGAIHKNFPTHHLAEWAKGAERRLRLVGGPLELSGTLLTDNRPFDINQLKGKVAVVCYWASHSTSMAADFARLKQALSAQKDVVLVGVNLDDKTEKAVSALQQHAAGLPAYHLAQATRDSNGLRGAMANQYGINVMPTLFLVGRDGRVVNAKLQIADLEKALKKAVQ